jgi:sec-independent protein translocase protein TatC
MAKDEKKKKKPQDLLDTTMSLGDHLEELRTRLILAILGLLVGTVICLFFGGRIIRFIEGPYLNVTQQYFRSKAKARVPKKLKEAQVASVYLLEALAANMRKALETDPNAPDVDPGTVTYVQKIYIETLTQLANDPNYIEVAGNAQYSAAEPQLIATAPADPFVAYMKITLISGLIISSPWVFYQLWMFVAAGLYEHERKYVRMAVPFSTGLFVIGALFFLFAIAPICLGFFLKFGEMIGVTSMWTFQKYVSFVTMLMLVFGLAFQTPIAIFVLNRTGLVSIEAVKNSRKYVIVAIFAVAAIATPPDVVSQIALAIPLYALFELGILLSWLAERKKKKQEAADSNSDSGSD